MFNVPIFGEMRGGSIVQFRKNKAIHGVTFGEIGVDSITELAVAASRSVLTFVL